MRYATLLRQELNSRNATYAAALGLPHVQSYGETPVVVYRPTGRKHGNFLDTSYRSILNRPGWKRRLGKVHAQAGRSLPQSDECWKELDSSMSSDALLMNVFCYPGVTQSRALALSLGFEVGETPQFGFRGCIPRKSSWLDRTEIDMKLGRLLVESKLTETDFQIQRPAIVESYRDFGDVFDNEFLPQSNGQYVSYQLIRNVLTAHILI
jgi:hypothetical protein